MKGETCTRYLFDAGRAAEEQKKLLSREEIVDRGLIPPTPSRFGFGVDDAYRPGSRMRVLGYSVEEDGGVSVTIFEPPEESIEALEERGWKRLQRVREFARTGAKRREEAKGCAGWSDAAFPIYLDCLSRGATTQEIVREIGRALNNPVKPATILRWIPRWRDRAATT